MSVQSGRPASDDQPADGNARPFTTGIGGMAAAGDDQPAGDQPAPPRPTFTARPSEPAADDPAAGPEPADAGPASTEPASTEPASTGAAETGVTDEETAADGASRTAPDPETADGTRAAAATGPQPLPDIDAPLLGDAARLRARWQRVQADFVDDPEQAVGDAADLIEQTAQALIGALRQRQRLLRVMWERGPVSDGGSAEAGPAPAGASSETEHLRLMMQHYRALFNQLCRP